MKTLHESILGDDFDINETDLINSTLKSILNDSVYDEYFDGEFKIINDSLCIDWDGIVTREFLFDELYKGIQILPVKIKSIKFGFRGGLKGVLLHVSPRVVYSGLAVWGRNIQVDGYAYSLTSIEIKFKNFSFLSIGNISFNYICPTFVGKSYISCNIMNLTQNYITTSKSTIIDIGLIAFTHPSKKLMRVLKKMGAQPLNEETLGDLNPFDVLFGCKQERTELRKIVFIFDAISKDANIAFSWNRHHPYAVHGGERKKIEMKDGWSAHIGLLKPWSETQV